MARRVKKAKRRSPKTVSLWNLGVGWVYLTGLTRMATGAGPLEFLFGEGDLAAKAAPSGSPSLDAQSSYLGATTPPWYGR